MSVEIPVIVVVAGFVVLLPGGALALYSTYLYDLLHDYQ